MSSSKKSNVALLTEGAAYIQRAKKARREQVEAVKFDDDARREYLTGFSKRKKQKIEERRARAKERDHQAHLEARKKARQELKERAKQNVIDVRKALGLDADEDGADGQGGEESEEGDDDAPQAGPSTHPRTQTQEYSDDDQLATVTITDDFDLSSAIPSRSFRAASESDSNPGSPSSSRSESPALDTAGKSGRITTNGEGSGIGKKPLVPLMPASSQRAQAKAKSKLKLKAEKEKSRSMETKAERKKGRAMELTRRSKKASIAMERDGRVRGSGKDRGRGGKAARGRGGKAGRGGRK